jgi:hypothetical protein
MPEGLTDDVMAETWCCLTCSSTFRFGQIRMADGRLHCSRCESLELHPATGETIEVAEYRRPVGTLN